MRNSVTRIGLYGFREKDRNAVAILMNNHPGIAELEDDLGHTDVVIVDLDGAEHQELWARLEREFSGPRIAVSVRDRDYADPDIFIHKPYHASRLIEAITSVEGGHIRREAPLARPRVESSTHLAAASMEPIDRIDDTQEIDRGSVPMADAAPQAADPASEAFSQDPAVSSDPGVTRLHSAEVLDITQTAPEQRARVSDAHRDTTEPGLASGTTEQSSLTGLYRHLQARNRVSEDDIPTLTSLAIPEKAVVPDVQSTDRVADTPQGISEARVCEDGRTGVVSGIEHGSEALVDPTDELPVSQVFDRPPFEVLETAEPEPLVETYDDSTPETVPPAPVTEAAIPSAAPLEPGLYYDPGRCLQGVIGDARAQALAINSPVEVCDLGEPLILCPSRNIVLTTLTDEHLESLSQMSLDPESIGISEVDSFMVETIVSQSTGHPGSLDAFLWRVAVLCSRGRLPSGTVLDEPVALEEYEELEGVPGFSEGRAIVALWRDGAVTLAETPLILNLAEQDVYSYYSAMEALGLIHHPGKRRSGLFSRLFHHSAQG